MRRATVRILLAGSVALAALAGRAEAQPGPAARPPELGPDERRALLEVLSEASFRALPPWHQRIVEHRYADYLAAPERRQRALRRLGLRRWLLHAEPPPDGQPLPPALRETVDALPEKVRPLAARLAFMRLRQLQLDHGLARVPAPKRWDLFDRRFPEPYDHARAQQAHAELKRHVAKSIAAEVRVELGDRRPDAREIRAIVRGKLEAEQRGIVDRVRQELFRFRGADPRAWKRFFDLQGFWLQERLPFATPRQRELVRYALRPRDCPLLDLSFLGPRPEDPAERAQWEWDYRVLGRLELLLEAGLNRETALYLASMGSPQDLYRAAARLGKPDRKPIDD